MSDLATKRVVFELPGMSAVDVHRDLRWQIADDRNVTVDLYMPPHATSPVPAVVFVSGYRDPGGKLKRMGSYDSWGRLVAVSGMASITYANEDPSLDLQGLLHHIRDRGTSIGIDGDRVGLWACSGNVPVALAAMMSAPLTCAAFLYGYLLDLDGTTDVAHAATRFGFANPCAGRSIHDLPAALPLFLARAGCDEMPGLNTAFDRSVAAALAHNLPISIVNHPSGPHAFDLVDDSDASRAMAQQVLAFLTRHLAPTPQ